MISVTRDEMLSLPPVVDVCTAAEMFGLRRSAAYELVRTGQWPTPVVRLGRFIRIPTNPMLDLLGVTVFADAAEAEAS